ncbi:Gldg family protein [bacterium]|nr:Gldg family protein [bacterium]
MTNALTIARRELKAAFDLPIAYVIMAAFLALSSMAGLVGFFDRGVADLRDYFSGLRYVFVLFAPAIAMRLWAEERRTGTFELLFTLPVRAWEAVLGKFLGALGLVAVTLGLGAVLPLTLAPWASFDAGAIATGYLGSLLLAALQLAIGLLVSALTENQIIAFVGGAAASLLLLVAGEPFLLAEAERISVAKDLVPLRALAVSALAHVGTGEHQEALARGVIDSRDLVYFVAMTCFFLVANVVAVERRPARRRIEAALTVVLAFAAAFLAEDLASRRRVRLDATRSRSLSLSPAMREALARLELPLTIRCYLTRDLSAATERYRRAELDLLSEIAFAGGSNVRLEVQDPRGDSRLAEQAEREGVAKTTQVVQESESVEQRSVYDGIALLYGGRPPATIQNALSQPNLEYELALAIRKLIEKTPRRVAFFEAAPPPTEYHAFTRAKRELRASYTVEDLDVRRRPEALADYQTLVVPLDAASAGAIDERALEAIDRFVLRGGSLVLLVPPYDAVLEPRWRAYANDFPKVRKALAAWGLETLPAVVVCEDRNVYSFEQGKTRVYARYPFWLRVNQRTCEGSPIASQLPDSFFPFAGEVRPGRLAPGVAFTRLLVTPEAVLLSSEIDIDPTHVKPLDPAWPRERRTIAAAVRGPLPGALSGPGTQARDGCVVVFACTDFLRDYDLQLCPWNGDLFRRTIDWVTQDPSLAYLKARSQAAPLDASPRARQVAWGVNVLGLPLLVTVAGVLRFAWRRRASSRAAVRSRSSPEAGPGKRGAP